MVEIYDESDYASVALQKKKFLIVFFATLAVLVAIDAAVFVYYARCEYGTPLETPLLIFNIVTTSIYLLVYYVLFEVKFRRMRCYSKMLADFKTGLEQTGTNAFVRVDGSITEKDGVQFLSLVFLEWSEKKQDYFERDVLFDLEKPLPEFKKGDMVKHRTQGNVMVAYELYDDEFSNKTVG